MARKLYFLLILLVTLALLTTCVSSSKKIIFDYLDEIPAKNLENYDFDQASSIISRLTDTPDFVLDYLKEMDNVYNYTSYYPTDEEIEIIESYIELLPQLHQKTLEEKLLGIYFINDFIGSGMADYVLDKEKNIYSILILNPETLNHDISTWMTHRENTCFINDNDQVKIQFECGSEYLGLMYILLHETTHIVDYIHEFTPYVEENIKTINKGVVKKVTPFIENIWNEYNVPVVEYDKEFHENITFYGLGGGPKLSISSAQDIYDQLVELPFASLYGSRNWAEDFAEMAMWYHFTEKLGQPYEIKIYINSELLKIYKPMDFKNVMNRFHILEILY